MYRITFSINKKNREKQGKENSRNPFILRSMKYSELSRSRRISAHDRRRVQFS